VVVLNAARTDEAYKPGISLVVLPGDKVQAKVWAKYLDLRRSELNANALIAALTGTGAGFTTTIDGAGTAIITDAAGNTALLGGSGSDSPPQAYLNYYLFDQNFQLIDMGFTGVTEEAAIDPKNMGKAHQELVTPLLEITQPGYLRIELSHDAVEDVDIYFDDLTVSHQQSPLLSVDDYYPFGLSIEGTAFDRNNPQYKGRVNDGSLLPQDYVFRQYDPVLGRFSSPDPLGELTLDQSPYHYGNNNPVLYSDPLGLKADKNIIQKLVSFVSGMFKREMGSEKADNTRSVDRAGRSPH
jgi:RHS repeat-associated protein